MVAGATLSAGCGGALYAIKVNSASSKVAQAQELGAEKYAPYEYYYANEHLDKAMAEAAEADYRDAIDFADVAEKYADKAIKLSKRPTRGGPMSKASARGLRRAPYSPSRVVAIAFGAVHLCQGRGDARQDRGARARSPSRPSATAPSAARRASSRWPNRTSSSPRSSSIRASSPARTITSQSPSPTRTRPTISRRPRSAPSAASCPRDRDGDGYPTADKCPDDPELRLLRTKTAAPTSRHRRRRHPRLEDSASRARGQGRLPRRRRLPRDRQRPRRHPRRRRQVPATSPEDPDGYEDADGCPEPDNDKDSVPDLEDQCPNEPGPPGGDKPGLPEEAVARRRHRQGNQDHAADPLRVRQGQDPEGELPDPRRRRRRSQQNPKMRIEVQGHTDNKGSAAYNKKLSDRRAASVKKYLVAHGIAADRLVSHGYGMDKALVPNDTDQNRALNRRVQFIRTEGGQVTTPP